MQNKFNIVVDSVEHEIVVNKINDVNEWIKALSPAIESYCENIYYNAYDHQDDFDESFKKELSEAYTEAVSDYIKLKNSGEEVSWKDTWYTTLCQMIEPNELCWDWNHFLDEIQEEILDTLENCGIDAALYPDLDQCVERLGMEIEEKILSEDDSTVFDAVGHIKIPLMYVPGKKLGSSNDEQDVYRDEIRLSDGDMSFLRLTGAGVSDYIKAKDILLDERNIEDWLLAVRETEKIPNYVNPKGERLGINCSSEKMTEIVESGGGYGLLPCWVGRVSIDDLRDNEPSLRFAVKGGFFGLVDFSGGSGHINGMGDGDSVVIEPECYLEAEGYYSTESIFGFYESSFAAEIIPNKEVIEVAPADKKVKKRAYQLNLIS